MESYSQNREDLIVKEYFGDRVGTLLSVGENNGVDYSNALLLIKNRWGGHLFEPSSVCNDLLKLHKGNKDVHIYRKGLGAKAEVVSFYESANHVKNGKDKALVSTTSYEETLRWRKKGVQFVKKDIQIVDFGGWYEHAGKPKLEFISIDVEGMEWEILQQIDLGEVGCEFLIIEWNGDKGPEKKFTDYCSKFGLEECGRNSENLMFSREKADTDREAELKQLLEEYGMEEAVEKDGEYITSYVWYKGCNLRFEGLAVEGGNRKEVVEDVMRIMRENPQWKKA